MFHNLSGVGIAGLVFNYKQVLKSCVNTSASIVVRQRYQLIDLLDSPLEKEEMTLKCTE